MPQVEDVLIVPLIERRCFSATSRRFSSTANGSILGAAVEATSVMVYHFVYYFRQLLWILMETMFCHSFNLSSKLVSHLKIIKLFKELIYYIVWYGVWDYYNNIILVL